jgi:hypothetical protein
MDTGVALAVPPVSLLRSFASEKTTHGKRRSRMTTKFDVDVQLSGTDGNAFLLLGKVSRGILEAGGTKADVVTFQEEATSGDYNHLLVTCQKWVNVS